MISSEPKDGNSVKIVNFKYVNENPSCEFVDETGYFVGPPGFFIQCEKSKGCKLVNISKISKSVPPNFSSGTLEKDGDKILINMGHFSGKQTFFYRQFPMTYDLNENRYLISHNPYYYESGEKVSIFSWDDEANFYVVKLGSNYVLFDSTFNETDHCSTDYLRLITRKEDFCSPDSSEKYLDCVNGICKSKNQTIDAKYDEIEKGYAISNKYNPNIYAPNEDLTSASIPLCTSVESGELCNSGEIKEDYYCITNESVLYKSVDNGCQKQEEGIYILATNDEINYKVDDTATYGLLIYICNDESGCDQFSNSVYFDDSNKVLYNCSSGGKCQKNIGTDKIQQGYYVSGIKNNEGTYNELIHCIGSIVNECNKTSNIREGYYLNAKDNNSSNSLINCIDGKCTEILYASNGYYLSADDEKPLIYCDGNCKLMYGISNPNYIIDQGSPKNETTKLITCEDSKQCSSSTAPSSGFFIDGSSSDNIIFCYIYRYSDMRRSLRYLDEASKEEITKIVDENENKSENKSEIESENESENKIEIENENTIKKKEFECIYIPHKGTDKAPTNFYKSTGILHCVDSGCTFIPAPESSEPNYYVNDSQELIICSDSSCAILVNPESQPYAYISSSDTENKTLILCESEDNQSVCTEKDISEEVNNKENLFFIDGSKHGNILRCTDSTGCESISYLSDSKPNEILYFIDGSDAKRIIICNKNGCERGEEIKGTQYFTDASDPSKMIICVEGNECISSKMSNDENDDSNSGNTCTDNCNNEGSSIVKICIPTEEITHKNCKNGYYALNNKLYLFNSTSTTKYYEIPSPKNGVYINAANINKLIVCEESNCSFDNINNSAIGFYINAAATKDNNKKLIECTNNNGCILATKDSNGGYYVNAAASGKDSKKLIKCDDNECAIAETDSTEGYYINAGVTEGTKDTKKLILCDDIQCSVQTSDANLGVYVNAANSKKLISCTNDSCNVDNEKDSVIGYYINAADAKKLINCNETACVVDEINSNKGYYINAAASGIDSKKLINCN
ncbi:hypothetical protein BCR36DRAFT_147801 [Piromyces finnis]|uniref:Scaffoldin n=1 Tax=Piromyces finnis TaxID=1754191 RepID=A0A1Y1UXN1_9FUNG|nr:hypothetical protein BCR36DRAFT_147801 [Piromyces finnis]|eukprot:ORX43054.1 hypothetical protein BCR36DRAFT_147801 [Piromyces finnis]